MFNPFNPFQSFGQSLTDAAGAAAKTADNAGNTAASPFSGLTSGPFGPAFGATEEKVEAGMQEATNQWQAMFDPQKTFGKLFDMSALKSMFPAELTQAWSNFVPNSGGGNPMEQAQQVGQHLASQAQQTMQAMQNVAQQAAQQGSMPTGPVSGALGSVDLSALIAAQQKNMDVLGRAQSATVSGWQQVMKRQAEIFHDTMQAAATAMNELMATGVPEEKLARQADLAKQAFEAAGKNIEELAKLVTDGNQEAMRVIGARVQESLDEIKAAAQKIPTTGPLMKAAADGMTQAAEKTTQAVRTAADNAMKTASDFGTSTDAVQ